jgi:cell division septation protein DedD
MRFPYAIECGRFLVPEEARMVTERLDQAGFFPYSQTFPTSDDRTLTRILVGCYFSMPRAEGQKQLLEGEEFPCEIVER